MWLFIINLSLFLLLAGTLLFFNVRRILSGIAIFLLSGLLFLWQGPHVSLIILGIIAHSILIFCSIPFLRQSVSRHFFKSLIKKLPTISQTEQSVLEAGDVWWEKQLFMGRPKWRKFLAFPKVQFSSEETAFLEQQVTHLCHLLNDWSIVSEGDLPEVAWQYIKAERFLGLAIPKKYGGHGFSAYAHSTIIMKIASCSYSAAVNIMVPNSVGLGEFILQFGSESQKAHYLSRLVVGDEIPCFALTGPEAGSDAGAMTDTGIVTWMEHEGERQLGVRLNWEKRYITLAPIATLIGLAFKLYDPEHLLGGHSDLGITLAMIPRGSAGVSIGTRHQPLFMAFLNGPIRGKDVMIPLSAIIGGDKMVGQGWKMMMECLSVGRGLSLPALSTATARLCYRTTSAYATLREQFHLPIGCFEGIQEPLARIGGFTYLCEAARRLTVSAIDQGIAPAIATAMTKYHLTELCRKVVNDAMDIHGGRGIQLGPSNYLGLYYIAQPISITVEGANILTRNLMIFGQGTLRAHPYIREEVEAFKDPDPKQSFKKFDRLFWKHIGYVLSNGMRCFVYGLTGGRFIHAPVRDVTASYYRQLTRMSSALAWMTDLSLAVLGGKLKQRERLSARLGDILSHLYLAGACLKYYEDQGRPVVDLPFVSWVQQYCLAQMMNALDQYWLNFPFPRLAEFARSVIFPWGQKIRYPSDAHDQEVAKSMMQTNDLRDRLTEHTYLGKEASILCRLEYVFKERIMLQPIYNRLHDAVRAGQVKGKSVAEHILAAQDANILTEEEGRRLMQFERDRLAILQVDEF